MVANTKLLIQDFLSKVNEQFIIPIFQRPYTWTKDQCERLLEDIYKTAQNNKPYFLGYITYQMEKTANVNTKKLYLVDGQQRITTILLIAKALNLIAKNSFSSDNLQNGDDIKYIINKTNELIFLDSYNETSELKLITSYYDKQNLDEVIKCEKIEEIKRNNSLSGNIINNFIYIYDNLYSKINTKGPNAKNIRIDVFNGLLKLYIVDVQIDAEESPEEIFESINSLGVKLTAVDSIRNYLFMNNNNQEILFETRWKPIQDELIGYENMNNFIMHYLVMKLQKAINKKDIYDWYIKFAKTQSINNEVNKEKLLDDLYEAAQAYEPFLHYSDNYSKAINNLMQEFRDLDQTTSYAFLLRVFLDYKQGIISEEELAKIVNFILVYVVRRLIVGVASNLLRPLMFGLYDKLFRRNPDNKKHYYQCIYDNFTKSYKLDKIPNDNEVRDSLLTLNLYKNKKLCRSLLFRIQNNRYPCQTNNFLVNNFFILDDINIEHIIPEDLTSEWEKELGENSWKINSQYGNTIGNLTLSLKTHKIPNSSFELKKKFLLNEEFTILNGMLKEFQHFSLDNLIKRSKDLIEIVIERYKIN